MARHHDTVESEQRSFREMLLYISDRVTRKELEQLKFYSADFIPLARRDDIEVAFQLFEALMEKERLCSSDTTYLQELMEKAIGRLDLLDRVIQYTNYVHTPPQTGD